MVEPAHDIARMHKRGERLPTRVTGRESLPLNEQLKAVRPRQPFSKNSFNFVLLEAVNNNRRWRSDAPIREEGGVGGRERDEFFNVDDGVNAAKSSRQVQPVCAWPAHFENTERAEPSVFEFGDDARESTCGDVSGRGAGEKDRSSHREHSVRMAIIEVFRAGTLGSGD